MRASIRLALFFGCLVLLAFPANAEKRIALVIGNDSYPALGADEQLERAVNDSNAVGDALEKVGFTVTRGKNLSRGELLTTLLSTADKLAPGDLAFFFYAGHGVSIDGANYLLPVDIPQAAAGGEELIKLSAVAESTIVSTLKARGVRVAMVVLDACRNNPFSQGGTRSFGDATRGLARPPAIETQGVFGLYSAGFGEQALDRLGDNDPNPNSVFTRVLVPAIETPGESLLDIAYAVNDEVSRLAETVGHKQNPAYYDQARARDIYLAGLRVAPPAAVTPPPAEAVVTAPPAAGDNHCAGAALHFETARQIGGIPALQDHLKRFGDCSFAGLAEMLIEKMGGTAGEQLAALTPGEEQASGGASTSVEADAIAKGLIDSIVSDTNITITYDKAGRVGADVSIDGLTITSNAFGGNPLRFTRTVVTAPVAASDGGFSSPRVSFIDGVLGGTAKGSVGSVAFTDFATLPRLLASDSSTPTAGFTFTTLEAVRLRVENPQKPEEAINVARFFTEAGKFVGNRPQDIRGRIEGVTIPASLFEQNMGFPVTKLGYNPIAVSLVFDGSFDLARATLSLRDLSMVMENGGTLSVSAELRRVPELRELFGPSGNLTLPKVEFQKLSLRYDDNSFMTRFLDQLGTEQSKTRLQLADEATEAIPRDLSLNPGFELKLAQFARAFIVDPRSFTFSMEPDTPLSSDDIKQITDVAPETLHDRLRALISVNSLPQQ